MPVTTKKLKAAESIYDREKDYSVEEASRCASINATACGSAGKVQAFAAARSGGSFASSVFTASTVGCGNQVSASYPMRLNIPFTSYAVTLTAQSCYPI